MPNKKTLVAFSGTPEQEAQLKAVIEQYKDVQGGTMPVMQAAQKHLTATCPLRCSRSLPTD